MSNQILLHQTPLSELTDLISDIISEQFKKHLSVKDSEPGTRLRTRQETAQILGVSLPTLHDWTKHGIIQGNRIGSRVRYKMADIESALKNIRPSNPNRK